VGRIVVGTASWTDSTLVKESDFYPKSVKTPEQRLRFYAERFRLVEVDATYYRLPAEAQSKSWVERTPADFVFDVKAFRLFTGHPAEPAVLPKDIRAELADELQAKKRLYLKDLPQELEQELWRRFRGALGPLRDAGKLGTILLQFPKWFFPGDDSRATIAHAREHLPDVRLSVEFRHGSWLNDQNRQRTEEFLKDHQLTYVCVDEPQIKGTMPPLTIVTTPGLAEVRFHGRDPQAWNTKSDSAAERFKYLYSQDELMEWAPKIERLSQQADETHVLMNNCYRDFGVRNARQLGEMLRAVPDID
jgi:uncharacterized protein YecE (DUF72 family)